MNRYTKEYNKLKEELEDLENIYNEVKANYDNEYDLYNSYCDSIKIMKYQIDSLNKKYLKRWNMLCRGLSVSTFLTSSIIFILFNVNFFPSLFLSLIPTGIVHGGCIVFSDKIKKLPIFSSLLDKIDLISAEKQEIFDKNEEIKKVVSELCSELEDIKSEISSKKDTIALFEDIKKEEFYNNNLVNENSHSMPLVRIKQKKKGNK